MTAPHLRLPDQKRNLSHLAAGTASLATSAPSASRYLGSLVNEINRKQQSSLLSKSTKTSTRNLVDVKGRRRDKNPSENLQLCRKCGTLIRDREDGGERQGRCEICGVRIIAAALTESNKKRRKDDKNHGPAIRIETPVGKFHGTNSTLSKAESKSTSAATLESKFEDVKYNDNAIKNQPNKIIDSFTLETAHEQSTDSPSPALQNQHDIAVNTTNTNPFTTPGTTFAATSVSMSNKSARDRAKKRKQSLADALRENKAKSKQNSGALSSGGMGLDLLDLMKL
jgi:hypothetical protein